jgi:hypothetical protein
MRLQGLSQGLADYAINQIAKLECSATTTGFGDVDGAGWLRPVSAIEHQRRELAHDLANLVRAEVAVGDAVRARSLAAGAAQLPIAFVQILSIQNLLDREGGSIVAELMLTAEPALLIVPVGRRHVPGPFSPVGVET